MISPELKQKLDDLLAAGVISQSEYDAKMNPIEATNIKKFFQGLLNIFHPTLWLKDIASIFNVRKLIIYGLIIGSVYGYAYVKGNNNTPIKLDTNGKEVSIILDDTILHIKKDGTAELLDRKSGKKIKDIKVKDVPQIQSLVKPIGIDIHPFVAMGGGYGMVDGASIEGGGGLQLFKFYKWHFDTWLTNKGVYVGPDYAVTDNFGILAGVGKGFDGDNRIFVGGRWKF